MLFLLLVSALATGCPPKDDGPGGSADIGMNGDTGDAGDTGLDENAFDCSVNIRGTVPADEVLRDAGIIESYEYEFHRENGEITVKGLDADGAEIGQIVLDAPFDATETLWDSDEPHFTGSYTGRVELADGGSATFSSYAEVDWDAGFRREPGDGSELGYDPAFPRAITRTLVFQAQGEEFSVEQTSNVDGQVSPASLQTEVPIDTPEPSIGEAFEIPVAAGDGGFELRRYHRLELGEDLEADQLAQWTDESLLTEIGSDPAVMFGGLVIGDPAWRIVALPHLESCAAGESIAIPSALSEGNCVAAAVARFPPAIEPLLRKAATRFGSQWLAAAAEGAAAYTVATAVIGATAVYFTYHCVCGGYPTSVELLLCAGDSDSNWLI